MSWNRPPPPYSGHSGNPPPYNPTDQHSDYIPPSGVQHSPQGGQYPPQGGLYPPQGRHYPPNNPAPRGPQRSANPPPGVNLELWNWFVAVDEDGNGQITASELEKALVNSNLTSFNPETCRLMVGMFDADRNGTIDINEFASLWKYIQQWKACFDSFDLDRSGTIDTGELYRAFRTFGYNLSIDFCNLCVRVFDRKDQQSMKFDDFIQCCVMLKVFSSKFIEKDIQRTGVIRIYYEEFLKMALDNTIV